MECLDDIEQAHFYEDKVVTNKLPLNIRVIDFKKEGIASINCQDLNEDVVVRQKKEIEELKQQLIEKEQELKQLKFDLGMFKSVNEFINSYGIEKAREVLLQTEKTKRQDKISFCIEKLSRVRNRINSFKYDEIKCLNKKDAIEDCLEAIDNQIKQLKEKQDERN